jgi:hypothetical protein
MSEHRKSSRWELVMLGIVAVVVVLDLVSRPRDLHDAFVWIVVGLYVLRSRYWRRRARDAEWLIAVNIASAVRDRMRDE